MRISLEFSSPKPLERLPKALAADALISGIESKSEFLIAGIKIFIYGSKSSAFYVRLHIFPIRVLANYLVALSCIISPLSRIGTKRLRLGASIA